MAAVAEILFKFVEEWLSLRNCLRWAKVHSIRFRWRYSVLLKLRCTLRRLRGGRTAPMPRSRSAFRMELVSSPLSASTASGFRSPSRVSARAQSLVSQPVSTKASGRPSSLATR
jgi:hypothetical protein